MGQTEDYFHGKVAIVTGGAAGIGLALAEAMMAHGASAVTLFDRDGAALSRQIERLITRYRGRAIGIKGDVTIEQEVDELIGTVVEKEGKVDFLFNNAGAGFIGLFDGQTNEDWADAFALNFYGPLYGIRAALPVMRRQGSGHIVNIVSGIAFTPMAEQTMYAASKAALNALTLALRSEHWDDGVRFTSATPGTTATDIWGDGGPPQHAQTAAQAAATILAGVARNDRLVLGDASDVEGAVNAFNPAAAAGLDAYLLDVARRRRKGEMAV